MQTVIVGKCKIEMSAGTYMVSEQTAGFVFRLLQMNTCSLQVKNKNVLKINSIPFLGSSHNTTVAVTLQSLQNVAFSTGQIKMSLKSFVHIYTSGV